MYKCAWTQRRRTHGRHGTNDHKEKKTHNYIVHTTSSRALLSSLCLSPSPRSHLKAIKAKKWRRSQESQRQRILALFPTVTLVPSFFQSYVFQRQYILYTKVLLVCREMPKKKKTERPQAVRGKKKQKNTRAGTEGTLFVFEAYCGMNSNSM